MRADIHDGPKHQTLHTEAGYIDAKPKTGSKKLLATHGRTIHRVKNDMIKLSAFRGYRPSRS